MMKNLLLSLCALLFMQVTNAQTEHLMFKGVPIDGTLNSFVEKMRQKGLKYEMTQDGVSFMTGDYATYKNCVIGICALQNRDLVYLVVVQMPESDMWSFISSSYFVLKENLTTKYGEPIYCIEEFQTDSQPEDDFFKMHELRMDRCQYKSVFEIEQGRIMISIQKSNLNGRVAIAYQDKINADSAKSEMMNDL